MVHALEEIRRLLKPAGTLVDIHPVSESLRVEIRRNGAVEPVGELSVHQWTMDFQKADEALAEITGRGVFVVEDEGLFDSSTYYGSAAEMRTALRESVHRFARDAASVEDAIPHVDEMVSRSEDLIRASGSGGELTVRERTHIRRLRPA